jgi:hypothetical protein
MMTFSCDHDGREVPAPEVSTLKVDGPLRAMIGRTELHLSKPAAAALARWLGLPVERPGMETTEGPESVDASAGRHPGDGPGVDAGNLTEAG